MQACGCNILYSVIVVMKPTILRNVAFLLAILILAIGVEMIVNRTSQESFVPAINEVYKPYVRKVRNYSADKIEKFTTHAHVFLKKFRLM